MPTLSPEHPAFYIVGGTMPVGAASYLERDADRALYQALKSGELCYLLNARQMGKSSLINRVAQRLRADGTSVALLDLTAIGQNLTANQWYYGLLDQLAQQLRLEDECDDFWEEEENLGPLRRFFSALTQVVLPVLKDRPLVIAVDEIDAVRSITAFHTDEFFAGIRAFYLEQQAATRTRQVTFCLLGTATPSDLIEDARITPFNIGKRIELRDFTAEEARPLAEHLPGGTSSLSRILFWTGGHPYLTQSLCRHLVENPNATVDSLVETLFLSASARETDDNLKLASNRLLLADADQFALLSLYRAIWKGKRVPDDETNPLCDTLKLSGIVKVEKSYLVVRNGIYRRVFDDRWIDAHLPDADVRRQKQAFRRGLLLAGGIAALVLALVGTSTYIAIRNGRLLSNALKKSKAETEASERISYIATMNLIQREWEANHSGRVLELLDETKNSKERGFEWDYWNRQFHLGRLSLKCPGAVSCVRFSPDGKHILIASADNITRVREASTGKTILTLKEHTASSSVNFSPDGKCIITGSEGNTATVWDAETGKEIVTLKGHSAPVTSACFSPDGKTLLTASGDKTARVWEATSGKELLTLRGHTASVDSACFSPDGKRILTRSRDNTARVWNATTGKEMLTIKGHARPVSSVFTAYTGYSNIACFSPDGKRILTDSWDGTATVWEAASGKEILTLDHQGVVYSACFSPDGQTILTGNSDGRTTLWDSETGIKVLTIRGHIGAVTSAGFSPDGRHIVTGSSDETVRVWDARKSRETLIINGPNRYGTSVGFSADGKQIITGDWKDNTARVWDSVSGKKILTLKGNRAGISAVCFSPDGKHIVTGGSDTITVTIREAMSGKEVLTLKDNLNGISAVCYSPEGNRILTASNDNTARVWDATTGKEILALKGHSKDVKSVCFSPDGKRILTGSSDETAKIWDAETGKEIFTLKGHTYTVDSACFSPDGKRVVTGSADNTAIVWDAETGKEILSLEGHSHSVTSTCFSPDGKRIVTGSKDQTIKVWDVETGKEILTLQGHPDSVEYVSFSSDEKKIVAGSEDGTVTVWYWE